MPKSEVNHSIELRQGGQPRLGKGAENEDGHTEVLKLLWGQVADAGAVLHSALCPGPSFSCWEVSGSLCVLALWARSKGRMGSEQGPWMTQMSEMVKHISRL